MGNNASADTQRYLDGYPGEPNDTNQTKNVEFYSNKRSSKPDGDTIENIHKKWLGNYGLLEAHHGYIQWLFPIREDGLNHHAQRLQLHEANAIASDSVMQGRIITSYELMLDFYGMKLVDRTTGVIARGENWKSRYAHLNRSFHNYLRITRILKCLGEVGLEHFKIHFVKHVLTEIYTNRELLNCHESCVKYWVPVLRKEEEREEMRSIVEKFEGERATRKPKKQWDSDSSEEEKHVTKVAATRVLASSGEEERSPKEKLREEEEKEKLREEEKEKAEEEKEPGEKSPKDVIPAASEEEEISTGSPKSEDEERFQ